MEAEVTPVERSPRVRFEQAVRVVPIGGAPRAYRLQATNLSREGLFLTMERPLDLGTRVALSLEAGGRVLPFAQGEVVWSRGQAPGPDFVPTGFGVRFTDFLHPRAGELIEAIVHARSTGAPLKPAPPRPRWRKTAGRVLASVGALSLAASLIGAIVFVKLSGDPGAPELVARAEASSEELAPPPASKSGAPAPSAGSDDSSALPAVEDRLALAAAAEPARPEGASSAQGDDGDPSATVVREAEPAPTGGPGAGAAELMGRVQPALTNTDSAAPLAGDAEAAPATPLAGGAEGTAKAPGTRAEANAAALVEGDAAATAAKHALRGSGGSRPVVPGVSDGSATAPLARSDTNSAAPAAGDAEAASANHALRGSGGSRPVLPGVSGGSATAPLARSDTNSAAPAAGDAEVASAKHALRAFRGSRPVVPGDTAGGANVPGERSDTNATPVAGDAEAGALRGPRGDRPPLPGDASLTAGAPTARPDVNAVAPLAGDAEATTVTSAQRGSSGARAQRPGDGASTGRSPVARADAHASGPIEGAPKSSVSARSEGGRPAAASAAHTPTPPANSARASAPEARRRDPRREEPRPPVVRLPAARPTPAPRQVALPSGAARRITWESGRDELRVAADLAPGATLSRAFVLAGPPRLVFDIEGSAPKNTLVVKARGGGLKQVRVGRQGSATRVVVDLSHAPSSWVEEDGAVILSF